MKFLKHWTFFPACLALLLCGCESWCDRNKPAPDRPITAVPGKNQTAYTVRESIELMTQRLSFFFSMHAANGAPEVYLTQNSRSPAAFKLYASLLEAKVIRYGFANSEFQLNSVQNGLIWQVTVLQNGKSVFSRSVMLKPEPGK